MSQRPAAAALRHLAQTNRAVASVEFAISGIALFLFLLAIVNLGYLGLVLSALQHGAETAARTAAIQTAASLANGGSCANAAQVQTAFNNTASPPLPAATGSATDGTPIVNTAWTNNTVTNAVPGTYVTVTASYRFVPIGLPINGLPLSITATQMVIGTSGAITACAS